jgi:hypothetical protein
MPPFLLWHSVAPVGQSAAVNTFRGGNRHYIMQLVAGSKRETSVVPRRLQGGFVCLFHRSHAFAGIAYCRSKFIFPARGFHLLRRFIFEKMNGNDKDIIDQNPTIHKKLLPELFCLREAGFGRRAPFRACTGTAFWLMKARMFMPCNVMHS